MWQEGRANVATLPLKNLTAPKIQIQPLLRETIPIHMGGDPKK